MQLFGPLADLPALDATAVCCTECPATASHLVEVGFHPYVEVPRCDRHLPADLGDCRPIAGVSA